MKIQQPTQISAFGEINFVYEAFQALGLGRLFEKSLPVLPTHSQYNWKDILYSLFNIYFCGGDAIEDIGSKLSPHLKDNPYCKIPSKVSSVILCKKCSSLVIGIFKTRKL